MNNNYQKRILVLTVLTIIFTIMGSTLAYWNWTTNTSEQTTITFNTEKTFECSINGGGNITIDSNEKMIMPTSCTDPDRAIQRVITTSTTTEISSKEIFMSLWLEVGDNFGVGLTNSNNFKYALTKTANDCTTNAVTGSFNGITSGGKVDLLKNQKYIGTTNDTYYLYIWLDSAETSTSTMNQPFELKLNGSCNDKTREAPGLYGADGSFTPWSTLVSAGTVNVIDGVVTTGHYGSGGPGSGNTSSENLVGKIVIDSSVTSFGDYAFSRCTNLTAVDIPDGITTIGENAFASCSNLSSVNIPDSVTSLGTNAFANTNLSSIDIPESLINIGNAAFLSCKMPSVTIPSSVTNIATSAFMSCSNLTTINYAGTMAQWNEITFGTSWNMNVPATEVICSDGTVSLS